MSGMPPARVLTTGTPLASASRMEIGMLSAVLGFSIRSALAYSAPMSAFSIRPLKRTASAMPSDAARS